MSYYQVGVRWRTLEVHWRYEAWVTCGIEVSITWVTSMRYEGGVHKRPRQLAEVHASKPGRKSMVQRPCMRCEHTCDPADPTFCQTCRWLSQVLSLARDVTQVESSIDNHQSFFHLLWRPLCFIINADTGQHSSWRDEQWSSKKNLHIIPTTSIW